MDKFDYLGNADVVAIEQIYQQYTQNPESVDKSWQQFFEGFKFAMTNYEKKPKLKNNEEVTLNFDKEFKVINLIEAYRNLGHLFTKTNPVRTRRQYYPTLDVSNFGLTDADLNTVFQAGNKIGLGATTLRDIVSHLQHTYCQSIGVEFLYIGKPEVIDWLEKKMERSQNVHQFSNDEKKYIYHNLNLAVGFEQFIHKRFVGQKRFSLEGGETLIPAMNAVIERGAELGIEEFVIGMPHRGRLNVLTNIMKKPYMNVFSEFIGKKYEENIELGDVKYHLGYGNEVITKSGKTVHLHLAPNPSHLETASPVIQGIARAKIYHEYGNDFNKVAPILIHGDAAIAAQGVVYEVIQMAQLEGYKTGGTIHLVVNNQVGFTTNYTDGRSSIYCTDVAKVTRCPVFHVNGDDAEALVYTVMLAMEYRQRFHTDVFIDILGYRKYGHNEGDEPRFTQPVLYKAIAAHLNPRDIYGNLLLEQKIYSEDDLKKEIQAFDDLLDENLEASKQIEKVTIKQFLAENWKGFHFAKDKDFHESPETGVKKDLLLEISQKLNTLPADKKFFSKIVKLIDERKKMLENNALDWASCELMAYATMLLEQIPIRISGQDCERGTFSHRHAALVMEDTDEKYFPLKNLSPEQAPFHVYNSHLSEYGVMGFEYGYATVMPKGLTIWEAQFGDFHNVAQPIIDQYISSAEEKWGLMNGLVLLLPHGYEGQGPEHSSARIERFLTMAVNNNMQIVNCSTPASLFHVLRRQLHRDFRVPLVVFSPKSLLRHPKCVSTLEDLSEGKFQEVIDDNDVDVESVTRVVYCTGKIYYDLLERKQQLNTRDLAIVRIEQLHPLPKRQLSQIVRKYSNAVLSLWVQEEPENMGAWRYIQNEFKNVQLKAVTRLPSGSPATGMHHLHVLGQNEIVNKVFRKCDCELKNNYCGLQCVTGLSREEILKQFLYFTEDTFIKV